MVAIKGLAEDAVKVLESTLRRSAGSDHVGRSHVGIADILNRLDKTQSEEVPRASPRCAPRGQAIKGMPFVRDIVGCAAAPLVFDQVPIEQLVIALREQTPSSRRPSFLRSPRARAAWSKRSCRASGRHRRRELADARRAIVATVLKMIARATSISSWKTKPGRSRKASGMVIEISHPRWARFVSGLLSSRSGH
jgi:hypothetical protein